MAAGQAATLGRSPQGVRGTALLLLLITAVAVPTLHWLGPREVPPLRDPAILASGVLMAAYAVAALLAHRGRVEQAAHAMAATLVVFEGFLLAATAGRPIHEAVAFTFMFLPLLATGLLLPTRWVAAYTALGMAFLMGVGLATDIPRLVLTLAATLLAATGVVLGFTSRWLEEANAKLARRNAERQALMEAADSALLSLDEKWGLVAWNSRAEAFVRQALGHIPQRGMEILGTLPPGPRDRLAAALLEARYGPGARIVLPLETPQGPAEYEVAANLVAPGHGRLVLTLRDVTAEKARERERAAAAKQAHDLEALRSMNEFKARLLSSASHELNTPLTPIRMQLEMLRSKRRGPLTTDQEKSLAMVDRNLHRLETLVRDLLDVARLDADQIRLRTEPVELDGLVADAIEAYRAVAEGKRVRLTTDLQSSTWVASDPKRLEQVLQILLSNSMRHTSDGGAVEVSTRRQGGGQAVVRVQDDGTGFDPARAPDLWKPFGLVHEPHVGQPGRGLGLAIARGLVEAHGGHVGAESAGLGRGALFWFTLPVQETAASIPPPHAGETAAVPSPASPAPGSAPPEPRDGQQGAQPS